MTFVEIAVFLIIKEFTTIDRQQLYFAIVEKNVNERLKMFVGECGNITRFHKCIHASSATTTPRNVIRYDCN